MAKHFDNIVIGGGAYGCYASLLLMQRNPGCRTLLIERENQLFCAASYNNQARVHNGYHYPRSLLTALRSRINFPRFEREFGPAVHSDFQKLYAVARHRSNVTSKQFVQFCHRVGAEIEPAPDDARRLFDSNLIEDVFVVKEYAFDAVRLRDLLWERMKAEGVEIVTGTEAVRVDISGPGNDLSLLVRDCGSRQELHMEAGRVLNCTYASLNELLRRSGLQTLSLRYEATEMALTEMPEPLQGRGVTVMCGPFFSIMPFPPLGLSTLSHVSYTPHYSWSEFPGDDASAEHRPHFPLPSNFDRMRRDAARFIPAIAECRSDRSLWEIKTILPQSDDSDSRPILYKRDPEVPNIISIMGGKIDNIFDLDAAFAAEL